MMWQIRWGNVQRLRDLQIDTFDKWSRVLPSFGPAIRGVSAFASLATMILSEQFVVVVARRVDTIVLRDAPSQEYCTATRCHVCEKHCRGGVCRRYVRCIIECSLNYTATNALYYICVEYSFHPVFDYCAGLKTFSGMITRVWQPCREVPLQNLSHRWGKVGMESSFS